MRNAIFFLAAALVTAASLAAEPAIEIRNTADFRQTWNDKGSGADDDVALYRPVAPPGWAVVGDYAQGNYDQPTAVSYLVRGGGDMLRPPSGFRKVWDDSGSGADRDGSVWKPVAPSGYVCLGDVTNGSHDQPEVSDYRCLRRDLATPGKLGRMIWKDSGSGADDDVSVWNINDSRGMPTATFAANGSHGPPSGPFYTLEGLLPPKPAVSAEHKLHLLHEFAPLVWLAPGEEFFPSSVEWAFPHLKRFRHDGRYWLRTRQPLSSPSDDSLPVFRGDLESAPVYAFWVDKGGYADLVYYFYYPYNRGKSVANTIWGNHVGDWEHITVRLTWLRGGDWSLEPTHVYIAAHNFGGAFRFRAVAREDGTHPVVFSARGSHGSWREPGRHVYKSIPLLGDLVDECGEGEAWPTWRRVEAFDFNARAGLGDSRWPRWMSTDFANPGDGDPADPGSGPIYRWGNPEEGECVAGECRLNDGPTGPISKDVWAPDTFE